MSEIDNILTQLEEYMLTNDNIDIIKRNINNNIYNINNINNNINFSNFSNKINIKNNLKNEIFFPNEKDKLFWSFYIILNGMSYYELINNNHFKVEKDFKINSIEKLREIKDIIKKEKIVRNKAEDDLLNKECISLLGLHVLCILYEVSIILVNEKKYYEFNYGKEKKGVIVLNNKKYGISENMNDENLKKIKEEYYKIDNYNKPIKSISSYTISEIHEICNKLKIDIYNKDIKSKKSTKNKKDLYQEVLMLF